jgi:hypothetical protein
MKTHHTSIRVPMVPPSPLITICAMTCGIGLTIAAPHVFGAANFDWPQWQGPDRNAISKETGLLKE